MINNHKAPIKVKDPSNKISDDNSYGERKIQLTLQISFFFLDTGEIRTMDSKKIKGRKKKKKKMGKSEFAFESVDLLYYSLHKTRLTNKG